MSDPAPISQNGAAVRQRHADRRPDATATQGQKPPPPPRAEAKPEPLGYFNSLFEPVKPPAAGVTRESTDSMIDMQISNEFEIRGTTTNEEYAAVGQAMDRMVNIPDAWGKEADVNVTIAGRQRHVTVRLNEGGKVEGELLPDTGDWKPAKRFGNAAEGLRALQKDFGIGSIRSGQANEHWIGKSKDFKPDELEKIYDAVSKLGPDEQAALRGVKLARVEAFDDGKASGMFEPGHASVVKGVATTNDRLTFAGSAFKGDTISFIGGAKDASPASLETITHEIGHAIASVSQRKAEISVLEAEAAANRELKKPWGALGQALGKLDRGDFTAADFATKAEAARDALDALAQNVEPGESAALRQAATDAVAEARTALDAVPEAQKATAGKVMESLGQFEQGVTRLTDARDAQAAAPAKDAARLQRFLDMVQQNGVKPFTTYAATSMDESKPEEFFAEAFALYRRDPEYLNKNFPAVYQWFADGNHLER